MSDDFKQWLAVQYEKDPTMQARVEARMKEMNEQDDMLHRALQRSKIGEVCAEIDALSELKKGWNSYDADPPSAKSLENAKRVVTLIGQGRPVVAPSPDGGVILIWKNNAEDFCLTITGGDDSSGELDMLG